MSAVAITLCILASIKSNCAIEEMTKELCLGEKKCVPSRH